LVSVTGSIFMVLVIGTVANPQPCRLGGLVLEFSVSRVDLPEMAKWAPPVPG